MTSYSDTKPSVFMKIDNYYYLYRMNIEQVTDNDITYYKCDEYTIYTPLNSNAILEKVLNELEGTTDKESLKEIFNYLKDNKYKLSSYNLRKEIKENIDIALKCIEDIETSQKKVE